MFNQPGWTYAAPGNGPPVESPGLPPWPTISDRPTLDLIHSLQGQDCVHSQEHPLRYWQPENGYGYQPGQHNPDGGKPPTDEQEVDSTEDPGKLVSGRYRNGSYVHDHVVHVGVRVVHWLHLLLSFR